MIRHSHAEGEAGYCLESVAERESHCLEVYHVCFGGLGSLMHNAAHLLHHTPETGDSDAEQVCIYQQGRDLGSPCPKSFKFLHFSC